MADASKITDRAAELAGQAAAAAGPLAARAKEIAGQAAAAAGPIAEQARVHAVQGVDVVAGSLDKVTGGKYSEQIHSVATKVGGVLDTKPKVPPTDPTLKADVADLPHS
jgi:methyl-accepting chemotaxis protein